MKRSALILWQGMTGPPARDHLSFDENAVVLKKNETAACCETLINPGG